jgi:hypothetical protein
MALSLRLNAGRSDDPPPFGRFFGLKLGKIDKALLFHGGSIMKNDLVRQLNFDPITGDRSGVSEDRKKCKINPSSWFSCRIWGKCTMFRKTGAMILMS